MPFLKPSALVWGALLLVLAVAGCDASEPYVPPLDPIVLDGVYLGRAEGEFTPGTSGTTYQMTYLFFLDLRQGTGENGEVVLSVSDRPKPNSPDQNWSRLGFQGFGSSSHSVAPETFEGQVGPVANDEQSISMTSEVMFTATSRLTTFFFEGAQSLTDSTISGMIWVNDPFKGLDEEPRPMVFERMPSMDE